MAKFKIFLFAPKSDLLAGLLVQHNNVRESFYITPRVCEPYMRVRVRQYSNSVVDIAKALAEQCRPIVEYKVGENQGGKMVGTIRIPQVADYEKVVEVAKNFCKNSDNQEMFFTCRVSKIIARDEKKKSWVEVFAVERRCVPREVWQDAVRQLAKEIGGEAEFYSASVTEY